MVHKVGKLEQYKLLVDHPFLSNHIPATATYTKENLIQFLHQFNVIYIKHDTSGQGRGVYKVTKGAHPYHFLAGFSMEGNRVDQELEINQIHKVLHPFERLGRLTPYIVQEGIQSETPNGQPLNIRVHVQSVKGKWMVGGMYGALGAKQDEENGVINVRRGSAAVTIEDLLQNSLEISSEQEALLLDKISEVSVAASETIARHFPCRECGVDIGIDQHYRPVIFEVNTTPGIAGFYTVDKDLWQRIVDIRKSL